MHAALLVTRHIPYVRVVGMVKDNVCALFVWPVHLAEQGGIAVTAVPAVGGGSRVEVAVKRWYNEWVATKSHLGLVLSFVRHAFAKELACLLGIRGRWRRRWRRRWRGAAVEHRRDRVHGRRVVRHWPPRGKVVSRKRRLAGWGGFCLDWAIEACSVFSYSRFQRLALG